VSLAFRSEAYEEGFSSELVFKSPSVEILLERLSEPGKHQILDLGAPAKCTVEFFSRFPCTLYLEDIHRFLIARAPQEGDEEVDIERAVADALVYDERIRFDVVLGWDLLNYMDRQTIEVLLRRVARSCDSGTLLFLTGFTRATIPIVPARIGIESDGHLRYAPPGDSAIMSNPRYSPIALERMMPDFRLLHSFLLGEGMQEYLFAAG
jgi:hypothetical protein